jgi:hypothetical protein
MLKNRQDCMEVHNIEDEQRDQKAILSAKTGGIRKQIFWTARVKSIKDYRKFTITSDIKVLAKNEKFQKLSGPFRTEFKLVD